MTERFSTEQSSFYENAYDEAQFHTEPDLQQIERPEVEIIKRKSFRKLAGFDKALKKDKSSERQALSDFF